jgi:hypothetical protein
MVGHYTHTPGCWLSLVLLTMTYFYNHFSKLLQTCLVVTIAQEDFITYSFHYTFKSHDDDDNDDDGDDDDDDGKVKKKKETNLLKSEHILKGLLPSDIE